MERCGLKIRMTIQAYQVRSFSRGDPETAILHIAAIFDPISEQAQTLSRLLKTLSEMENVSVQIYLDPEPLVTEVGGY